MNRLLTLLALLILSTHTEAQTLHFLVFADTEDTRIGIPTNVTCIYLKELSTEISIHAELKENFIRVSGQNFTKANLQKTIDNLVVGPKDVVFAYIISHGWNNMKNEYPMMVFGPKSAGIDAGSINLSEIHQKISQKNPRLLIVFGEACNRDRDTRPSPVRGAAVSPPRFEVNPEQFRNLFRRSTKSIILCSSKRGQVSTSDMDKGGWFAQSFREMFEEFTSKKHSGEASWEALLESTRKFTEKLAYDSGSDEPQSPHYDIQNINLPTAGKPVVTQTTALNTSTSTTGKPSKEDKPLRPQPTTNTGNTAINEPCQYNQTPYQVNEAKIRYLEQYWKGLEGISNTEASELFQTIYSKDTKSFYENIASNLNLENFVSQASWFKKKGKEVIEIFEETNEYVDSKDFRMKALSKLPLALEPMKDITRRLDDIRRKCSE